MPEPTRIERLSIDSDPVRIREARRWLHEITTELGWTAGEAHDLAVALSEACANAHRYAYAGGKGGRIDLRFEVRGDGARLSVRDYGAGFDPRRCREPDPRDLAEGGYGILLMRRLTDGLAYEEPAVGTRVVMIKKRNADRHAGASRRGRRDVG
jgi:anti-sigma regulatory factor (Ser/Thr protein kinase)